MDVEDLPWRWTPSTPIPNAAGRRMTGMDLYTGVGALCWLPNVANWARVVADLIRPGGRLFIREAPHARSGGGVSTWAVSVSVCTWRARDRPDRC